MGKWVYGHMAYGLMDMGVWHMTNGEMRCGFEGLWFVGLLPCWFVGLRFELSFSRKIHKKYDVKIPSTFCQKSINFGIICSIKFWKAFLMFWGWILECFGKHFRIRFGSFSETADL